MSRLSPTARKPGIRDVARHAGVSHTMVSLILNGKHSGSPETRAKVMEAVGALGYELRSQGAPAATGRSSGSGSRLTGVLAFVMPKWFQQQARHQDGYYSRTLAGIMEAAEEAGYEVLMSPQCQEGNGLPTCILERRVDGVLLDSSFPVEWVKQIANCLPTVYLNRYYPEVPAIFVSTHWLQSVRAMVDYAWSKGHRNMAFLGVETSETHMQGTHYSFYEALHLKGGKLVHPELSRIRPRCEPPNGEAKDFVEEWIACSSRPTVLLTNDILGPKVAQHLAARGFTVPDDLSIIGRFGHLSGALSTPPLTTYEYPMQEIGERAVRLLVRSIKEEALEPSHVMIEGRLIERGSVRELSPEESLSSPKV